MDSFSSTRSDDNVTSDAPEQVDAPALAAQYLQEESSNKFKSQVEDQASTPQSSTDAEPPSKKQRVYTFLPNTDLYNKWAATYDSDGNILQGLDSWKLAEGFLERFLVALSDTAPFNNDNKNELKLVDLGCGTGRGTVALIDALAAPALSETIVKILGPEKSRKVHIRCLEVAEEMMSVARPKIAGAIERAATAGITIDVDFEVYDMYDVTPATPRYDGHGLISTLVLEHLPLDVFFAQGVAPLIAKDGIALVTNMHEDMGTTLPTVAHGEKGSDAITGAGFNSVDKGEKFRAAVDFAHTTPDTVAAARKNGLEAIKDADGNEADEVRVKGWMVHGGTEETKAEGVEVRRPVLSERGRKWIGSKCWVGFLFKHSS